MTRTIFIAAALALVVTLPIAPAQATGVSRTFVSAAGSDSNNCANVLTPCRHLAAAYAATSPNGEIYVLDPANYGSLTITGPVSIEGHGWASIAPPSGTNTAAITINANTGDKINIIGVVLDGTALASTNGIVFNSGGSLTVADSVVRNFSGSGTTGNGILLQPSSGSISFVITNTIVSNNGYVGIYYDPQSGSSTATGVIDHVVATNNNLGISINTSLGGGSTTVAISNGIASNNSGTGINTINNASTLTVSIDDAGISGNNYGVVAFNTTKVLLGRSAITGNGTGIDNEETSPNNFYSYQDNRINENTPDFSGTALNHGFSLQ